MEGKIWSLSVTVANRTSAHSHNHDVSSLPPTITSISNVRHVNRYQEYKSLAHRGSLDLNEDLLFDAALADETSGLGAGSTAGAFRLSGPLVKTICLLTATQNFPSASIPSPASTIDTSLTGRIILRNSAMTLGFVFGCSLLKQRSIDRSRAKGVGLVVEVGTAHLMMLIFNVSKCCRL